MAFELQPADIVIFFDPRLPPDPGEGPAVNRIGIVVDERGALSLWSDERGSRRVESIPLQSIPSMPNVQQRRGDQGHCDEIAAFFLAHVDRPTHFEAGLRALRCGNLQPLITGGFFPHRPRHESNEQFEAAWEVFRSCLQPADAIYTFDSESRISRLIAWATDGAWSHVAAHVGDGEIWESVTSGIRHCSIDVYKKRRYWVAAYRHIDAVEKPRSKAEIVEAVAKGNSRFRLNSYNYRGALKFGWKAFRGDHSHGLTPNSGILLGNLALVAHV